MVITAQFAYEVSNFWEDYVLHRPNGGCDFSLILLGLQPCTAALEYNFIHDSITTDTCRKQSRTWPLLLIRGDTKW